MNNVTYALQDREHLDHALVEECAQLFSNHYGVWSARAGAGRAGQRVRFSSERFRRELLFSRACALVTARAEDGLLVGHAAFCRFAFDGNKQAVWITQLVVHSECRNRGVARTLLAAAYRTGDAAVGLISSHPHAVRALERATNRKATRKTAKALATTLMTASAVPYLQGHSPCFDNGRCVVRNNFFVDHGYVNEELLRLQQGQQWRLGPLEEGEEFLAIINLQDPAPVAIDPKNMEGLTLALLIVHIIILFMRYQLDKIRRRALPQEKNREKHE